MGWIACSTALWKFALLVTPAEVPGRLHLSNFHFPPLVFKRRCKKSQWSGGGYTKANFPPSLKKKHQLYLPAEWEMLHLWWIGAGTGEQLHQGLLLCKYIVCVFNFRPPLATFAAILIESAAGFFHIKEEGFLWVFQSCSLLSTEQTQLLLPLIITVYVPMVSMEET